MRAQILLEPLSRLGVGNGVGKDLRDFGQLFAGQGHQIKPDWHKILTIDLHARGVGQSVRGGGNTTLD